ncbi:MAG: sensor histidine kinase N-terminal domain-containing protein, partial [Polymorphobacter sp.]
MKLFSLRRAMLGAIIVPLALAIAAMAGSAMWVTQRAVDVLLDNQMRQEAQFLLLLARHEATEGEALGLVHAFESKDFKQLVGVQTGFRIWSADIIMAQSATMPATRLPPAPGFTNHDAGGERWRTYAVHYSDLPVTVEIGQSLRLRRVLVEQLAYSLALPLLFLILAVA